MLQRDYWPCPFCDKGTIEVLVRPTTFTLKKVITSKGGRATIPRRVKEEVVILTQKCPVCGKSREEIEKKWKEEGII